MKLIVLLFGLLITVSAPAADVTLAWNYAGTDADGFRLRYKLHGGEYSPPVDIAAIARQYTHSGAPLGTILYKLTAYNGNGESGAAFVWAVIEAEPPGPPAAPRSTTVTITVATP